MRKHLLFAFGVAVDGLIAAVFGVEAFAVATVVLGLACAYAYRIELGSACLRVLGKSNQIACGAGNAGGDEFDPANGLDVACQVMTAATLEQATATHHRFMSRSVRDGDVYVAAALAIRQHREAGLSFMADLKAVQDEQPLYLEYGQDEYRNARTYLDERFPYEAGP